MSTTHRTEIQSIEWDVHSWLKSATGLPGIWRRRFYYRRDLSRLLATGTHLIGDLGLSPATAAAEAKKPFWRD